MATAVDPSNTRLGWIGTGVMGRSMCAHLINAGYTLTVFTRTPSKAQELISMGAHWVDTPKAVASQSDVVFSIVGYPSDVRQVILDSNSGALSGLRDRGARNAALSIFAGGEESIVQRLNPLFNLLGKVYYMGAPGKGQFTKLGNQVVIASSMVGLCEGLIYAHKAGLDLNHFVDAISTGAAGSKSLDLYGSRILNRDLEPGFYVNHFVKDLGICLRECQNMGLALPGLALAQQLYLSLKAHGEGDLGTQALILALERINNLSLQSEASAIGKP
uniref:6-phosphogluconate dehydrogenase NAD-binding domain-containing protein n=1 Tax=Solanum tuberosum TaxID=4113 RepID=M1CAQ3_SOLTU